MSIQSGTRDTKFVRRTTLSPGEYRVNFRQIDCDVIAAITSVEACRTTPHMSRIYLRLIQAPSAYWERDGVLRFSGEEINGEWKTGWDQILIITGVASATARKAFAWMSEQGIIGYFAGKNGVGIRIFLNRAVSSIRERPRQEQKNLRFLRASPNEPGASSVETPFKENYSEVEKLEVDMIPHAKARAGEVPIPRIDVRSEAIIIDRVVRQIAPHLRETTKLEHEKTRRWFNEQALPKAIRVAQRSAYDILRAQGSGTESRGANRHRAKGNVWVGAQQPSMPPIPRQLSEREVNEVAEGCVAIFYAQGKSIEMTLSEMGSKAGGFLLQEDIPRVHSRAVRLISMGIEGGGAADMVTRAEVNPGG